MKKFFAKSLAVGLATFGIANFAPRLKKIFMKICRELSLQLTAKLTI